MLEFRQEQDSDTPFYAISTQPLTISMNHGHVNATVVVTVEGGKTESREDFHR